MTDYTSSEHMRIMVASTLQDLAPTTRVDALPPHVTIFPWFDLETAKWSDFHEGMEGVIDETSAPLIQGGDSATYGVDEATSVRRLNRVTPTFNLIRGFDVHAGVHRLAHWFGSNMDDTFTGVNWSPHISDSPEFSLGEDEEVQLTNLTVFVKTMDGAKIVRAIYRWSIPRRPLFENYPEPEPEPGPPEWLSELSDGALHDSIFSAELQVEREIYKVEYEGGDREMLILALEGLRFYEDEWERRLDTYNAECDAALDRVRLPNPRQEA